MTTAPSAEPDGLERRAELAEPDGWGPEPERRRLARRAAPRRAAVG